MMGDKKCDCTSCKMKDLLLMLVGILAIALGINGFVDYMDPTSVAYALIALGGYWLVTHYGH